MTAMREITSNHHAYLGVTPRKHSKQMVLDEDIEALVEQLGMSFGTTFEVLKSPQVWSTFANLGVVKGKCGGTHIEGVSVARDPRLGSRTHHIMRRTTATDF